MKEEIDESTNYANENELRDGYIRLVCVIR